MHLYPTPCGLHLIGDRWRNLYVVTCWCRLCVICPCVYPLCLPCVIPSCVWHAYLPCVVASLPNTNDLPSVCFGTFGLISCQMVSNGYLLVITVTTGSHLLLGLIFGHQLAQLTSTGSPLVLAPIYALMHTLISNMLLFCRAVSQ